MLVLNSLVLIVPLACCLTLFRQFLLEPVETKACEYNKDIRTVIFDSLEKTMKVVRDENLEGEEDS